MAIRFNRLVGPDRTGTQLRSLAEDFIRNKTVSQKMVFMSHKTGDQSAETEADYIAREHGVRVYMAEWDDSVDGDSNDLPDHIMGAIRKSDGFLVNVTDEIRVSMWIGYEIGGAHAMNKARAKISYRSIQSLPSVVRALASLGTRAELDHWVQWNVLFA